MANRDEDRRTNYAKPVAAFVISLIAGLWMLVMGGMMGWAFLGGGGWGGMMDGGRYRGGGAYDWMWRHHQAMHGYGGGAMWSWIGVIAGIVVLVGAVVVYSRPAAAKGWGIGILVASAVDLLAGAGGLLGGTLGIIGGILAITWQPQT